MPLTRGEVVGYDADLMVFKYTMGMVSKLCNARSAMPHLRDLACRGNRAAARYLRLKLRPIASLSNS
jgi:hypothetical protein